MIVGGRYGLGYPVEGIDLPGVDPLLGGVYQRCNDPDLVALRNNMVGEYRLGGRELTELRQRYIPRVSEVVSNVYTDVRELSPGDTLDRDIAIRSLAETITYEREQRLVELDKTYHDLTGARRAITLTHHKRGPIVDLAQGLDTRKSARSVAHKEHTRLWDAVLTLVGVELASESPLGWERIAAVGVQFFVSPQIEGEQVLLNQTVDLERWHRRGCPSV